MILSGLNNVRKTFFYGGRQHSSVYIPGYLFFLILISSFSPEACSGESVPGNVFNPLSVDAGTFAPVARLRISIFQEPAAGTTVNPGEPARFTLIYQNNGTADAVNVRVRFFLPPSNLFTYSNISGGVYEPATNSILWLMPVLSPGISGTVVVEGYWGRTGAFPYNPASYYVSAGSSTNSYTPTASISSLAVPQKTASGGPVQIVQFCGVILPQGRNFFRQGDDKVIYYPMTISNTGNIYDNFSLSVPSQVIALSGNRLRLRIVDINHNPVSQSGWIRPNGVFIFFIELDGTLGGLKPMAGDIFNIPVTAISTVCGTTASADLVTITYNGSIKGSDLVVNTFANIATYSVGSGSVTYTIILTNVGDTDANGVVLTDILPVNGQSYPAAVSPAASSISGSDASGWILTWSGISITVNQTRSFTFTITPNCHAVPALTNTASAVVSRELNPADNASSIVTPAITTAGGPALSADRYDLCYNDQVTVSVVNPVAGTHYHWYNSPTGLIPVYDGGPVFTTSLTHSTTFYVSIFDPATLCESNRSSVSIVVDDLAANPGFQQICTGDATSLDLSANAENVIFSWSASVTGAPSGGSLTGYSSCASDCGSRIAQTLVNTGNTPGIVTYTVVPYANSCLGAPANVTVTVNPKPSASPIYHR